jgi:hypothetical protein
MDSASAQEGKRARRQESERARGHVGKRATLRPINCDMSVSGEKRSLPERNSYGYGKGKWKWVESTMH